MSGDTIPAAAPTAPCPPSPVEAKYFYYGIPSKPRLVARSSTYVWAEPTGPDFEASLTPKMLGSLAPHLLQEIWSATVAPAVIEYLDSKEVKWTSLDPLRIGEEEEYFLPAILWIGVIPGSLTAEDGVEAAVHCKSILSTHGIDDIHVEIRESEVWPRWGSHAAIQE